LELTSSGNGRPEQDVCRKSRIQSLFSSATVWSPHADKFAFFRCFLCLRQEVWVGWRATASRAHNDLNDYVTQSNCESDYPARKAGTRCTDCSLLRATVSSSKKSVTCRVLKVSWMAGYFFLFRVMSAQPAFSSSSETLLSWFVSRA